MEKLKIYGSLLLAMISVFMLGAYADATLHQVKDIELHQWVLTSLFGLGFLGNFLKGYKS